jgi:hypothetical protein
MRLINAEQDNLAMRLISIVYRRLRFGVAIYTLVIGTISQALIQHNLYQVVLINYAE